MRETFLCSVYHNPDTGRKTFWSATGEAGRRQPDNYRGRLEGGLDNVKDRSGLTVEGLQEYHDEACLAVLNNKASLALGDI